MHLSVLLCSPLVPLAHRLAWRWASDPLASLQLAYCFLQIPDSAASRETPKESPQQQHWPASTTNQSARSPALLWTNVERTSAPDLPRFHLLWSDCLIQP